LPPGLMQHCHHAPRLAREFRASPENPCLCGT
jgi:hypothetical protein